VWTDRHGGVSVAPYATANLGGRDDDDQPDAVRENRARLAATLGLDDPDSWWWLRQVHGTTVVDAVGPAPAATPEADAAVTTEPGRPLVVRTADCAPLALATDTAAGVVHVGWHGLLAGVVESAVTRVRDLGSGPVRAALGPCIHPDRYEFGADDLTRLSDRYGTTVQGRTSAGRPALNLPAGVRAALGGVGVDDLHDVDVCTAASPDHFSYRRDGRTGRQGVLVVLEP
jgi:polyphenol oxidase